MRGTVVIDCFPESAARYKHGYAIVAVDVIRATTTAITAVATGRRCFLVPTVDAAFSLADRLNTRDANALLAGELNGIMPRGFDLNNSPAELAARRDTDRPLILLSSSGTRLCHEAASCDAVFLACLRNYTSVARFLLGKFDKVAVIGAGSRGEFREEDQMCCAWVAEGLTRVGYQAKDLDTADIIERWSKAPSHAWIDGKSAAYLRRSGQTQDLDFIMNNVADLIAPFKIEQGEVITGSSSSPLL